MDNSIQAHQKELCNKLWAMANALRGNMEAYEFKNYILGMIFYYYLSDKTEKYMVNLLKDDGISYEEAWADPEYKEAVVEEALRDLGYVIEPQFLFRKMVKMVENRSFDIEFLQKAINSLMESTIGNDSQEDFDGLFSDMQLDSTKLGHTVKDRSSVMAKIISSLDEINFGVEDTKIDVLGNAYEYLIGQFAATAGKKAGEFYTPSGPAELLCRLACLGLTDVKDAADPTCGSGSAAASPEKLCECQKLLWARADLDYIQSRPNEHDPAWAFRTATSISTTETPWSMIILATRSSVFRLPIRRTPRIGLPI